MKASTPSHESFLVMQNTASLDFASARLAAYSVSLKQYIKHILRASEEQLLLAERVPTSFPNHRFALPRRNLGRSSQMMQRQFCSLTSRLFVTCKFKPCVQAQTKPGTKPLQDSLHLYPAAELHCNLRNWPRSGFSLKVSGNAFIARGKNRKQKR